MLLNPANLAVKPELDDELAKEAATNSPLENKEIVKKLLVTLSENKQVDSSRSRLTQALILKIFVNQIEVRGKPFIDFLDAIDDGSVMKTLMEYLQARPEKGKTGGSSVLPINWLESKIMRIRKLAIETGQSLTVDEQEVTTMLSADGEQLIVKRTNLKTKDTYRTNHFIAKAVNPHRVLLKHPYQSYKKEEYLEGSSGGGHVLKDGLVLLAFADIKEMKEETMNILCKCEIAVVELDPTEDLNLIFKTLFQKMHEDFELPSHK